eukprot:5808140-Prymnesium_polylepis.1
MSVHERARACTSVHERARACTSVHERARACMSVHERAHTCVHVRVCGRAWALAWALAALAVLACAVQRLRERRGQVVEVSQQQRVDLRSRRPLLTRELV